MKARIVDFSSLDETRLAEFSDRTVWQTREWVAFVAETQGATPLLAELREDGQAVGYFTGLTFSRFGVRVLGSSFPGWTTPYMGFNLAPGVSRRAALAAVERLAWDDLKCLHMEISDPNLAAEDGESLGFAWNIYETYRTDLTKTEDELFKSMESACRRCIRKAEKSGVVIEEAAQGDLSFADEYYEQLKDVFAKQRLTPTYSVERVRALIRHLHPTGRLLLLRARDPQGRCIATGIYPGYRRMAQFWGNASFRDAQILRPNQYLHWHALRSWKQRGAEVYDWGGGHSYKEKYGCTALHLPWFVKSRHQFVAILRDEAKRLFELRRAWLRRWRESIGAEN